MRRAATALVLTLAACSTLSEFSTGDDEVFRGQVVGRAESDCPGEPCSFIRRGFPEDLDMELFFDPAEASSRPGTLRSDDAGCGRFFDGDALLPITPLSHDDLSLFEFPGARLQNYIFAVNPAAGPLAGRDVVVFVALRDNGDIGLRVMAGSGARLCDPTDCEAFARGECDVFGVFSMQKTLR